MRRAQDGFWIIYHDDVPIGEIKGLDQANWLIDRLKATNGGFGFYHATYPTSRASFTGVDKIPGLMRQKVNV